MRIQKIHFIFYITLYIFTNIWHAQRCSPSQRILDSKFELNIPKNIRKKKQKYLEILTSCISNTDDITIIIY